MFAGGRLGGGDAALLILIKMISAFKKQLLNKDSYLNEPFHYKQDVVC